MYYETDVLRIGPAIDIKVHDDVLFHHFMTA